MNDGSTVPHDRLALDYRIEAPAEKVWRAISDPALVASWLPREDLADPDATAVTPGEEVSYRMRDSDPPFLESIVTFSIAPNPLGGTTLRIIHRPSDERLARLTKAAANNDGGVVMLAA